MDPLGQWLEDQDIDRWSPPSSRTASLDDTLPFSPRSSSQYGGSDASSNDYVPSSGPDTPPSSPSGSSQSYPPPSSEQAMSEPVVACVEKAESSRRVRRRIGEPQRRSPLRSLVPQNLTMDTLTIQETVKKIEPGGRDFIPGRISYPQDFLANSDGRVRAKTQDWLVKLEGHHAATIKRHSQLVKELEDMERGIRKMEAHPEDWVRNGLERVGLIPEELREYCITVLHHSRWA